MSWLIVDMCSRLDWVDNMVYVLLNEKQAAVLPMFNLDAKKSNAI